jgi:adenosylhomocysteinase
MSKVKDMKLAKQGHINIALAEREMPVLRKITEEFKKNKPFKNMTVAMCLHVTKETAVLAKAVAAGGAEVVLCCSNPLSL